MIICHDDCGTMGFGLTIGAIVVSAMWIAYLQWRWKQTHGNAHANANEKRAGRSEDTSATR
ncbi:MAG: hypothetical protein MI824_12790 [Hyphomicrobiales bacterium]|nr:hypothetical protein [Hyphomicrobiales bacterium]